MKEQFLAINFGPARLHLLGLVSGILDEYDALGYDLSLRQLYYQLVARGHIENSLRSYKRIGELVNDGRLAGELDWEMIRYRGREFLLPSHWSSPGQIVQSAARSYRIDKWADQPSYVEVMVEKAALEGVLIPVCTDLDVGFTSNRGYCSSSTLYEAGKRLAGYADDGRELVVFYLGDHDPSGIDMTRDVQERLELFAEATVDVRRIALNYDQIARLHPPENPAKETDSRYADYVARWGESSWELDAIEPRTLAALVTAAVESVRDEDLWTAAVARERQMRAELSDFARKYKEF